MIRSGPLKIKPYWIQRGLVMVNLGSGYFWARRQRWVGQMASAGGPVKRPQPIGIVTGFGSTLGGGTTDRVGGPEIFTTNQFRSIVFWSYARGLGGSSNGRFFTTRGSAGGSAHTETVAVSTVAGRELDYIKVTSTASVGQWGWPGAGTGPELSVWKSYGLTHDQSSILTTPLMYINGQPVTTVVASAPASGVNAVTAYIIDFGNRSTDNARVWDGLQGPCFIFDGPLGLSAQEHAILGANPMALFEMPEDDVIAIPSGVVIQPMNGLLGTRNPSNGLIMAY